MTNKMQSEMRLPQNPKEGLIFMMIISILSVNTIAPVIVGLERGFSQEVYLETLKIIPVMWVIVVLVVTLVAEPIAGKLMPLFAGKTDGFNATVLLNTLLNVTIISLLLSIIGNWVGTKQISMDPFTNFLHIWPRNFAIAFWIELLFAQPIARFVMKQIHLKQESRAETIKAV
jgi:hypothetical protein